MLHRDGRPPPSLTPHVVYHFSLTITDESLGLVILSGFAPAPLPLSIQSSFRRRLQGQETQQSGQFNEMSPAVSVSPTQDQQQPLSCHKADTPQGMFHISTEFISHVHLGKGPSKKNLDGVWMNILFVTFKFSHLHDQWSQLLTALGFLRWGGFFVFCVNYLHGKQ